MSVQTEINRIVGNITAAFAAIGNKGGTVPSSKVSGNLATAINSIPEGVELNFEVVGGTSQPSNPKENTIWVNTSTTITSWVFSAEQPSSPKSGMVWIQTGNSSGVSFNALKKNDVQVYPLSAKQYVYYSWKDITSKIYQGGSWKNFVTYLYDAGDKSDITGGWGHNHYYATSHSLTVNENTFTAQVYNNDGIGYITPYTENDINLSAYSRLGITIQSMTNVGLFQFGVGTDVGTNKNFSASKVASSIGTHYCDIQSIASSLKVKLYMETEGGQNANIVISKIWFE